MAEDSIETDEADRLSARRERMAGPKKRGVPFLGIVFIIILFLLAAVFVVFPDQARRLLGLDTSSSRDIQETSRTDNSGISTNIVRAPNLDVAAPEAPIEVIVPKAEPPNTELDKAAKARIAALEKALQELANRPISEGGPTANDIKKLLDQQAAALRAEAETRERLLKAQLDALLAQNKVPTGPTAEELAEAERLRLEAEEKERLRQLLAERKAAREAELLKRLVSDGNVFDGTEEGTSSSGAKDEETGVRELSNNEKFLASAANTGWETSKATKLEDISKTIVQGTIIAAVLETAINTELPGNIRAQVMRPVYSYDGQTVLMPAGTRLIGSYNPEISIAQKRVLIAWNRAITPDGQSVKLAATGVDRLGRGGQAGNVDSRFFQRFGTAALISTISALPSLLDGNNDDDDKATTAATNVAGDVSDDLKDSTEDVLEEYLSLPPIIRIPQGTQMNVLVNQDMVFS